MPTAAPPSVGLSPLPVTGAGPLPTLPSPQWTGPQTLATRVGRLAENLRASGRVDDAVLLQDVLKVLSTVGR